MYYNQSYWWVNIALSVLPEAAAYKRWYNVKVGSKGILNRQEIIFDDKKLGITISRIAAFTGTKYLLPHLRKPFMPQDIYPPDSNTLLHAIRHNDEQVLKQLYTAEYAKTEKYVVENSGTREQAKDIFQEAFIAVWRNVQLGKFKPAAQSQLTAYLYQVARNKWIDYLRSGHHKNMVPTSHLPTAYDAPEVLPPEEHQYLEAVKIAVKQLGENCRELLQRFYYRNEPVHAIAEAMEWTEATVRNNKYRCMERLRQMLKKN